MVKGEAVGRTIGFPTANLKLTKKLKIKPGVYAALCWLGRERFLGLAYFGRRYIFKEKQDSFEVFLFNFNRDIYGQSLKVRLLKFLRPPRPVTRLERLKQLLEQDVEGLNNDVVLVDKNDQPVGLAAKAIAHQGKGQLHRAISVYLYNSKKQLLVQKRAAEKPLWPQTWANSCCSHPRPGESYLAAAQRRVREELGLKVKLKITGQFIYRAQAGKRGSEYERDTVLVGKTNQKPRLDKNEVAAWQYAAVDQLPQPLAPWVKLGLKKINLSDIFKS